MKKTEKILEVLKKYSSEHHFKHLRDPFKTLIKTILSQRTRDENTERAYNKLIRQAKTPEQILKLPDKKMQELIKEAGFYRQKTKKIKQVCRILLKNKAKGKNLVPESRHELLELPGVGMKTADIVLSYSYGKPVIAIDIHCEVISKRLGLAGKDDKYDDIKKKLEKTFRGNECYVNHGFVEFGKKICLTNGPRCWLCPLFSICKYEKKLERRKRGK